MSTIPHRVPVRNPTVLGGFPRLGEGRSRTHARVVCRDGGSGARHILIDLRSTCGTFVNETRVDPNGAGVVLEHGNVISLGPSQTSTYVCFRAGQSSVQRDIIEESSMVRVRPPQSPQAG